MRAAFTFTANRDAMTMVDPVVSAVECSQIAWQTYLASDEANEDAALEKWGQAFEAAVATQPMTRLGAIMLIEHVIQIEKSDLPDSVMALLDRLHAFLHAH
jgi:hypothetical protein